MPWRRSSWSEPREDQKGALFLQWLFERYNGYSNDPCDVFLDPSALLCTQFAFCFTPFSTRIRGRLMSTCKEDLEPPCRRSTSYCTTICGCLRRTTTKFLKKVKFSVSRTIHWWDKLTWRKGKWQKEHWDACQREMLEKSVVAEHAWKDHNSIRWEEATVVDKAKCPEELPLKKALHIYSTCPLLRNASTGTLGLGSQDDGWLPWGSRKLGLNRTVPWLLVTPTNEPRADRSVPGSQV